MTEYIEVGFISRTHGFKGGMIISLMNDLLVDWDAIDTIMYGNNNQSALPGFIKEVSKKENRVYLILENVQTLESAASMVGMKIFCEERFVRLEEKKIKSGYSVNEKKHGYLGKVVSVQQLPGQELIIVEDDQGNEILLPHVPEFLISIDHVEKTINYEAPDGLIEIYKQN